MCKKLREEKRKKNEELKRILEEFEKTSTRNVLEHYRHEAPQCIYYMYVREKIQNPALSGAELTKNVFNYINETYSFTPQIKDIYLEVLEKNRKYYENN